MNIAFFIVIIISLLVSTITSIWIFKKKEDKWIGMLVAFCINTLVLSIATILLYNIDVRIFHKETDGLFGSLGILVLVFFIPINTFINYLIVEFFRSRSINVPN